ncbi:hypothetical protein CT0861_06414 [Colletotrichum tofieldiae]|uniref:Uncharacterized protein n=1 Tax=Colletotrichum tofieldiae TaxID=708197 RepID=A0A166X403_9PEZI|nr:hypothetical protein CT0861_06414 [Colletotrichum tofieldiae]GKT86242.1 hypothetical protein Ct61P_04092 [Colletotrichum tofieldiae]
MPSDSLKSHINHYPVPSLQDNADPTHYDATYDLPSTKCLGTFRTMATGCSSPPENRPLNPNVMFPPMTPPSHASSDYYHPGGDEGVSPKVFAKFPFSFVGALRVLTIALSIVLIVLEIKGRYSGLSGLFITFAILQFFWLILALLTQGRGRRGGRRRGCTIDLGFVKCIFGRRGRDDDAHEGGGMGMLAWMDDGGSKESMMMGLVYTALDVIFAANAFTTGVLAADEADFWIWQDHAAIAVIAILIGVFDCAIAVAEQFAIFKRAKVQVMWDTDEEDDLASHKYRIRLPQHPEQRHATMSVAA